MALLPTASDPQQRGRSPSGSSVTRPHSPPAAVIAGVDGAPAVLEGAVVGVQDLLPDEGKVHNALSDAALTRSATGTYAGDRVAALTDRSESRRQGSAAWGIGRQGGEQVGKLIARRRRQPLDALLRKRKSCPGGGIEFGAGRGDNDLA